MSRTIQGFVPGRGKRLLSPEEHPDWQGAHAASCSMGTWDSFHRDKAPRTRTSPLTSISCQTTSRVVPLPPNYGFVRCTGTTLPFFRPCKFEKNYVAMGITERRKFCRPSYIIGKCIKMQWDTSSNRHKTNIYFIQTIRSTVITQDLNQLTSTYS